MTHVGHLNMFFSLSNRLRQANRNHHTCRRPSIFLFPL